MAFQPALAHPHLLLIRRFTVGPFPLEGLEFGLYRSGVTHIHLKVKGRRSLQIDCRQSEAEGGDRSAARWWALLWPRLSRV